MHKQNYQPGNPLSCQEKPEGLGPGLTQNSFLHSEHSQHLNRLLWLPTPSGLIPTYHPTHVPSHLSPELCTAGPAADAMITQLQNDVVDMRDNLLLAKVAKAHHAKMSHADESLYNIGDKVMLNTFHRQCEYKWKGEKRVAKFFPQWDGPYTIIKANTESSSYTLNNNNDYPYYSSQLKHYHANDAELFPGREHPKPGPIMTDDRLMEHEINK